MRSGTLTEGYISSRFTFDELANANLEVNLSRSHKRGFGWPLWVTVASTKNNLEIVFSKSSINMIPVKNIATGEMLQAIAPFHFFDNFHFFRFYD